MCPSINNFIKILNNDLKPSNVLQLIKKNTCSDPMRTKTVSKVPQAYYLPFLPGYVLPLMALNLKSQNINNNDNALREVYEVDKEVFAQTDPYEDFDDFKAIISESNLSTYSISDDSGNILGYYQFEPIKDGDLYIDSMGLKKEFRKTKKGYQAIKFAWAEILKYASENNVKTLSIHLSADDKSLLNMYTKMGFVVKDTLLNHYANGSNAIFMMLEVPNLLNDAETEANLDTQIELSPRDTVIKSYIDKCNTAINELKDSGERECIAMEIIKLCSYFDKNGHPVINEDLKFAYLKLNSLLSNNDKKYSVNIFENFIQEDFTGVKRFNAGVFKEVEYALQKRISGYEVEIALRRAFLKDCIDTDFLRFFTDMEPLGFYRNNALDDCLNADNSFNKDVANLYRTCMELSMPPSDLSSISKVMIKEKDGVKIVKPLSVLYDIKREVEQLCSKKYIYTYYSLRNIFSAGCDIEEYLKYCNSINNRLGLSGGSLEIASVITACMSNNVDSYDKNQKLRKFDYSLLNVYKKYEKELITDDMDFRARSNAHFVLGRLIDACKLSNAFTGEFFDENIMQKALLLRKKGLTLFPTSDNFTEPEIISIINACKREKMTSFNKKEIIFDDLIFNRVIEKLEQEEKVEKTYILEALKFCKQYNPYEKAEIFNCEAFDLYNKICENQERYYSWHSQKKIVLNEDTNYPKINMNILRIIANELGSDDLGLFLEDKVNPSTGVKTRVFNYEKLQAFKKLNSMNYALNSADHNDDKYKQDIILLSFCSVDSVNGKSFCVKKFEKMVEFLEKGFDTKDILFFWLKSYEQITIVEKYLQGNMDLLSASWIAEFCYDKNGQVNADKLEKCLELYRLGLRGKQLEAINFCSDIKTEAIGILEEEKVFNEIIYMRLKSLLEKSLSCNLITVCKDNKKFSDRLFKLLMNLKEKGYPNDSLKGLMEACFAGNSPCNVGFSQNIYDKIFELEKLGIEKDEIANVLKSCKYQSPDFKETKFSEEAYKKIPELYYKDYDDKGIAKIIEKSVDKATKTFSQERFEQILKLSAQHKRLRDVLNNDDGKVIAKLLDNEAYINSTLDNFGDDVVNYAISMRVGGFTSFAQNCNNLLSKMSPDFISELKQRLDLLSSPELKVKRLQILGALSSKVSEQSLIPLLRMIESTKMTDTQKEVANAIFANESLSLDEQIERFVKELDVPKKNKEYIINYLREARLDKQINRPAPIIEQLKQMEEYAQQMLTNSKIPLEKKIKYIDEFKAKFANMQANPEKYTTPRLFPKAMKELRAVVESYINIPNSDAKINNAIYEVTYSHLGIEPTDALLKNIIYDLKYFAKLLVTTSEFRDNFRNLIELVKLNEGKLLEEMRITLPEEGTPEYEKYERFGLIKQIKANFDTKRQFEEVGLDFARWNSYDKDLISDSFDVEIDTEQEYDNLRSNIVNELYGELISKIREDEVDKLFEKLKDLGFVFMDKEISYLTQSLNNSVVGKLIDAILKYTEQNSYWQNIDENSEMTLEEKESINGFLDHVKGFKKKFEDIQNGKNVSNLRLRLANMNDIGRNIFFGNHVFCCNKVESDYAGYSAPLHLINSYIRGMEIVDEFGNSYGNSQCYFALIDGKVTFVIDSFEANGKLASNPIVTEKIVNYAKQVCKAMGCEDAPIVFGPRYNHLSLDDYESMTVNNFKVLGTVSAPTYCDTLGGLNIQDQINSMQSNIVVHTHKAS